jgi:thiamine-phosphate pyrophosphorylase
MPRSTLFHARLYGIVDLGYASAASLIRVTAEMIEGGIDVIQLRAKGHSTDEVEKWGAALLPICREAGIPFFINDHAAVAASLGADGVHVGQDDAPMDEVRTVVGPEMLVGRSTHSLAQAAAAAADPRTDCIGFGPLFATPTKPTYQPIGTAEIREVHLLYPDLPIFCIGGVKKENLADLVAAGAKRAVIVSGILQAPDIAAYVRSARSLLS